MIVVRVIGGLGNQLFQIAYAMSLAKAQRKKVYLDLSAYETYKIRSFSANNLILSQDILILNNDDISKSEKVFYRFTQTIYRILQKFIRVIGFKEHFGKWPFKLLSRFGLLYNFDNFYYQTPKFKADKVYIYGYFQSEKYFEDVKNEVISYFQVKHEPDLLESTYLSQINSVTSIAVSMRLGDDYKLSKEFNVCDSMYYKNAIFLLKGRFSNAKVFIFSDDIERAKYLLSDIEGLVFIEGCNDYQSLRLMYSCQHFIISNSSFSWWGAYLSQATDKTIIAPNKWYGYMKKEVSIYTKNMERL